ncbi:ABC transporter substrate-binding protein [Vogesella sp. LIG4]|uniref:ABC transporter substrate-binding protein n=1 Tax=Vogesella sp. LIG4 TaxID=1192162 RepID=UPI00081F9358|nr:ABC transporter substrate-binding protein [Vogesella sp. LIG4]SCK19431.1 histidine transport system substrate-binding protein [Vogesella sp. LIG4]
MKLKTLCAVLLSGIALQAGATDLGNLRIGTDASYPPFESLNPSGQIIGFEADLAVAVCKEMKARCSLINQDWDGIIPGLIAKKYDLIISSMTITSERAKTVTFTERYFRTPQRMIAAKGSPLKFTPEGMNGKHVGVQRGTTADMYLSKFWAPRGMDVVRYEDQDKAYADLMNGRLDASFQDELQVEAGFLKSEQGKRFAFVGPSINGDNAAEREVLGAGAGMAVRKEDKELVARLNKAIAAVRANGTFKKLSVQYFGRDIY